MVKGEISKSDRTVVSHIMAVLRHPDGFYLFQVANNMRSTGLKVLPDKEVVAELNDVAKMRREARESGSMSRSVLDGDDDDCSLILPL